MLERDIQRKIIAWLRLNNCRVEKYSGEKVGHPDLIAAIPQGDGTSITLYIEVKKEGGRLSNLQKVELNQLRAEGHLAVVSKSLVGVQTYLSNNGISLPATSKTSIYRRWKGMVSRCENPNASSYKHYGGRGIVVCKRWRQPPMGFYNFLDDMGLPPFPNASIDRIDSNGDYEPGNCRWATPSQQMNNKQHNAVITLNGVSRTIAEWAEVTGIRYATLYGRMMAGWSAEDILSTDLKRYPKPIICVETQEIYLSVKEASLAMGVDPSGFFNIINGKQKRWGGLTWEYYDETTHEA